MAKFTVSALIVAATVFPAAAEDVRLQEGRSAVRNDWTARVERSRQDTARFIGTAVDAFRMRQVHATPMAEKPTLSVKLPVTYLQDPTLRYGDVIAVEGKLIVFHGESAGLHRASEFEEIDKVGTLGGVHDRELYAIDKELAYERGRVTAKGAQDAR